MPALIDFLNKDDNGSTLNLTDAREPLLELEKELNQVVIGLEPLVHRLIQSAILNGHILEQGVPGGGKTRSATLFADNIGYRSRRVQGQPDLLPSDLVGGRRLDIQGGSNQLVVYYGPVFNGLLVMDEINRAPPKVQSALLEAMQERQITRIDLEKSIPVLHPDDMKLLATHRHQRFFGVDPSLFERKSHVPFVVVATQNPLEMEGTYPLPEAQVDRFLFKLELTPSELDDYSRIVESNLNRTDVEPPSTNWIKAASFFHWLREKLVFDANSLQRRLLTDPVYEDLWKGVRLIVRMTHHKYPSSVSLGSEEEDDINDKRVERIFPNLLGSEFSDLNDKAQQLLTSPLFDYVEYGCSNRGLIDWPRAAIVECFLDPKQDPENLKLEPKHFRNTAGDVLAHRLVLNPLARTEGIHPRQIIEHLVEGML